MDRCEWTVGGAPSHGAPVRNVSAVLAYLYGVISY